MARGGGVPRRPVLAALPVRAFRRSYKGWDDVRVDRNGPARIKKKAGVTPAFFVAA
jgi:hypothetical protein